MNFFSKLTFIIIFTFNISQCFAQSSNITIISSPDKEVAASAQSGANTIQILNSSGLSFASTFNIGLVSLSFSLIVVSVWDGRDGEQSNSSSTTN